MRSDKLRRITFLLGFLGLVFLAALPLIVLRSIQKQSYRTQSIVKAPESVFRYWRWPGQSWQLYHEDLTLISQPSRVFTGVDGKITPQLWNLLMGCSSGTNIALNSLDVTVPSLKDGVQTLRSLLLDLSREAHLFHKYVCHSTGFSVNKGRLRLSAGETQYDLKINKLGYQKAEAPGVEIDGVLKSGELFGLTLTYKPEDDILVFTSDLGHQARFDGQIESFSSAEKSFLSGELHSPAVLWSQKNKKRDVFSAEGTFTISANLSGELADLTAQLWSAETLRLDGAVDARTGTLKPFNLPADVLREAGQIPALTQLNQLIQERALPKSFYVDETPFELLRFLVHKEGRLIT
ncbi:MAG: hypothetical protein KBC91_00215, partial [Candidatus Omnitrophica bacterium]|nr:hypothetical protein [Candidatus Omnitrophota bacterium]